RPRDTEAQGPDAREAGEAPRADDEHGGAGQFPAAHAAEREGGGAGVYDAAGAARGLGEAGAEGWLSRRVVLARG
ncbi:unnamed protein product, partial [Didymodactylos carnosus]